MGFRECSLNLMAVSIIITPVAMVGGSLLNNGKSSECCKECLWNLLLLPPGLPTLRERGFHFAQVHAENKACLSNRVCYHAAVLKSHWRLVQSSEKHFPHRSFSSRFTHWLFDFYCPPGLFCAFYSITEPYSKTDSSLSVCFIHFCFYTLLGKSSGSFQNYHKCFNFCL